MTKYSTTSEQCTAALERLHAAGFIAYRKAVGHHWVWVISESAFPYFSENRGHVAVPHVDAFIRQYGKG